MRTKGIKRDRLTYLEFRSSTVQSALLVSGDFIESGSVPQPKHQLRSQMTFVSRIETRKRSRSEREMVVKPPSFSPNDLLVEPELREMEHEFLERHSPIEMYASPNASMREWDRGRHLDICA